MKSASRTSHPETKRSSRASTGELLADGFYILMPLLIIGFVGGSLIQILHGLLSPVLDVLPGIVFRSPWVRFLLLLLLVVLTLMLIGLLSRPRGIRAAGAWLESTLLNNIPLYSWLRGLSSNLATRDDMYSLKAARITVDIPGLEQLGVIMERHHDGSATVFLPSAPNASSGTVVIVEASRIREVSIPLRAIVGCMGTYGYGTGALLEKAEAAGKQ